ncbi:MAG TPA: hypothetical protein VK280_01555 [Streptosporangiaceae bacterium]|nr:hypothetical protein [Streptosporangiaceae bacterium]
MSSGLFALLPAVYRLRDAQIAQSQQLERGPLESLLMVIDEQVAIVADDLTQLYEDQFIETCAPWVIPYIGDLIGYQSVRGIAPAIDNPRAEVAQTISLRRRKGTVLVLEQLARDATGWGAHAVEFFQVLGDTQYLNHVRPRNYYAPDLRRWQSGLYLDSAFDRTSHRVDVRRISSGRGRYNIQNVGVFLWSLGAYGITDAPVTPAATNTAGGAQCCRFSSLGMDMPLFHRALSQGEQISAAAEPVNVAARLRRRVLCADLLAGVGAQFYGPAGSLLLTLDGTVVNPYQIKVANLSGPDGAWVNLPADSTYAVVVDPELGRLALPPPGAGATAPQLNATYYYGFNADLGGGDYARTASFVVGDRTQILRFPDPAAAPPYTTLPGAVTYALGQLTNAGTGEVAVELADSDTYLIAGLTVDLPAGKTLEVRAADGARPTILLGGEIAVSGDASSQMVLNGLVVAAGTSMAPGSPTPAALVHLPADRPDGTANLLSGLSLTDCTLVPGWSVSPDGQPEYGSDPVLIAEPAGVAVSITRSILGAIRADALATVAVSDSIVDATGRTDVAYAAVDGVSGGAALTLSGCTVVGKVHAALLSLVSDSIVWAALAAADTWTAGLVADRKQEGCVRFSFLPYGSVTPRRFECVEQALAGPQPLFGSLRYGDPGYLKLLAATEDVIRRGADDAGEMGAFHFALAPQRETDLKTRLQEYIPVGLEYGLIYQD